MNYQGQIIGPPGCGKTTLARALARRHLDAGGWLFAHDPVGQYRDLGVVYASADEWRRCSREAAAAGVAFARGASFRCAAADVISLCMEIGDRHNRAHAVRVPMLLVLDETSMLGTSGASWMAPADNELLSTRRHRGIGVLFLQQRVKQLPSQFYEMSTDVYLFRQSHERRLAELEESLSIRPGTLGAAASLGPFKYLHVKTGSGPV